jgi:hypothetical protein
MSIVTISAHLHALHANSWHAHNMCDNLCTDNWSYTVLHVMGNNSKLCQYLVIMLLYNLYVEVVCSI